MLVVLSTKKLHLLAGTGVWKIRSVACGFSSIKIDYSDYPKSLISEISDVYVFGIKYRNSDIFICDILLKKKQHINFIKVVCYAAITLVIVLTWFLCPQCHVI